MNKRYLHHLWKLFRHIKPQYVLIILVISTTSSIIALRANNEHMEKLRNEVYAADENAGDVHGALRNLQAYVTAHMNTNLSSGPNAVYPPIQLKYTYDRLVQAASEQTSAANTQLYTQAQQYCQQQDPTDFSGHNRVPCIEQYVETHGATLASIPSALYQFDFISPVWSPDLAGWSVVVAILSAICFVLSYVTRRWFMHHVA
jgi:outer membrane murein-binding lipoprotein Lpp